LNISKKIQFICFIPRKNNDISQFTQQSKIFSRKKGKKQAVSGGAGAA